MPVCTKCKEEKPDAEFVWDDGIRLGVTGRCKTCRAGARACPDCLRLRAERGRVKRGKKLILCDRHQQERLPPGVPLPRFPVRRHAVARFGERMRPDILIYREALHVMLVMMEDAEHSDAPQDWYQEASYDGWRSFKRGYLHVADGAMFSLSTYGGKGIQVATVLTSPDYVPAPAPPDPAPYIALIHETQARRYQRSEEYRERIRAQYGSRH